jgi:hypothetical protein
MSVRANKYLLLLASLATLALLVLAAFKENYGREWRRVQRDYRAALPAPQQADFEVQLRQVYAPAVHATDRCISCHVGMAPGESGIKGNRVFTSHPDVGHDPLQYGCVVCHGGQGRATDKADAHGTAPHWPEPMLPLRYAYAGCGGCHTHLAVPNLAQVARGRASPVRDWGPRGACGSCRSRPPSISAVAWATANAVRCRGRRLFRSPDPGRHGTRRSRTAVGRGRRRGDW